MSKQAAAPINDPCWRQIGVWGDQSCTELAGHVHCRNCPVYIASGRQLFDQPAPADYLEEWHHVLAEDSLRAATTTHSVMVFLIGSQRLALDAACFLEVQDEHPLHRVPHVGHPAFLGLVNLRGRLHLCVSLAQLLGLTENQASDHTAKPAGGPYLIIVEKDSAQWIMPVTKVEGLLRFDPDEIQSPPVNVSKATGTFTKSVLEHNGQSIAWLDEELLFYHLKTNIF